MLVFVYDKIKKMLQFEDNKLPDNSKNLQKSYTVSKAIDDIGYGKFQFILTIILGFANLSDAMEMMILSLIGPILTCSSWHVSITSVASLTTTVFLGMSIAHPIWGFIADNYGRRRTLIVSCGILLIFGLASTLSPSFTCLLIFRFFYGTCLSCLPQSVTLLMEYLPSLSRGRANLFLALIWACGASVTALIGRLSMNVEYENRWRILVASGATPVLLFLFCSCWLPESILYLVQNNRKLEAQEILRYIHKKNQGPHSLNEGCIHFDDTEIYEKMKANRSNGNIFCNFIQDTKQLLHPGRLKLTIILWVQWLLLGIISCGVLLLSTSIVQIWNKTCYEGDRNNSTIHSKLFKNECISLTSGDYFFILWTSMAELPGGVIALCVMDIIGRKKTLVLMGSIFTSSLFLILMGCNLSITMLTVLLFIARGASVGYGQCLTIYTPEVYPTHIRAIGVGTAFIFVRLGCMVTPYLGKVVVLFSWQMSVVTYGILGLLLTVMALFLPIESMGLDLSTLDQELINNKSSDKEECLYTTEEQSLLLLSESK